MSNSSAILFTAYRERENISFVEVKKCEEGKGRKYLELRISFCGARRRKPERGKGKNI